MNSQTIYAGSAPFPTRWGRYTGTENIPAGATLCFDHDASTAALRGELVEKPSLAAIDAGAVAGISLHPLNGAGRVEFIPLVNGLIPNINVLTDDNVAVGDFLGAYPGSWYARKAVVGHPFFRAAEAVDRSASNGQGAANGSFGLIPASLVASSQSRLRRLFEDFLGDKTIATAGATSAEIAGAGWAVRASAAYASYVDTGIANAGVLRVFPITTTIGQLDLGGVINSAGELPGLPFLISAGRSIFVRQRVALTDLDPDFFAGIVPDGSVVTAAGAVPALDDYIGFYVNGDVDGSIHAGTNKNNGTDNLDDTGVDAVAATFVDLAFLARNKKTGTAVGDKEILYFVNGTLVVSKTTAAQAALFPDDLALRWAMGSIDGTDATPIDIDSLEINYHL